MPGVGAGPSPAGPPAARPRRPPPRHVAQAAAFSERALAGGERLLGPDNPDTLTSRNHLAGALQETGASGLERAVGLYERTLAESELVLGPEHPRALLVRNNLADALSQSGECERAVATWESVLADSERILGADHPDTLLVRGNLAAGCWRGARRGRPAAGRRGVPPTANGPSRSGNP
ncbi:tetratricopeptide repeat protein [Streptomyces niveus]|uniref:tetratricopeptide repeat protein n=1 Tax=Streptomyces niveus TaxID=193462 RepID=UPI00379100B7